jgi:hypothetical protein
MTTEINESILRRYIHSRGLSIVITGADGSGKTTLATRLVETFRALGLPARCLHVHAWYANLLVMPFLLVRNRFIDRKVLILDRSIYDNLAVLAAKRGWVVRPWVTIGLKVFYPGIDRAFYLHAERKEIALRRPDTDLDWHDRLSAAYAQIIRYSKHCVVDSDEWLYSRVVAELSRSLAHNGADASPRL